MDYVFWRYENEFRIDSYSLGRIKLCRISYHPFIISCDFDAAGTFPFREEDGQLGQYRGDNFTPLTNFTFRFLCKVMTPSGLSKDFTGFVVEVTHGTGTDIKTGCISFMHLFLAPHKTMMLLITYMINRKCFLSWSKTQQNGLNLAKELGSALPECTLISKLTNNDMKDIFWMKLAEYQR